MIANFVEFSVSLHHKRSFCFRYNLDDQSRQETGELKRIGDAVVYVVTGSYRFVATNGKTYRVNYVADEKGFRAKASNATVDFDDRFNPESEINPTVIKTLIGKR